MVLRCMYPYILDIVFYVNKLNALDLGVLVVPPYSTSEEFCTLEGLLD